MAVFCQRLDRQPDGSVDVVGVVDGIHVTADELAAHEPESPPMVRLLALVSLRAGEARGRHVIGVRGRFPSGEIGATLARPVDLTDANPGATLTIPLELEARDAGTYWFDVLCNDRLLTSMPLIVQF
jgi:hypothetical protein